MQDQEHEDQELERLGYKMTHAELVNALAKPGEQILGEMTPSQAHIMHMVLGMAGEIGEIVDAAKKNFIYQKPVDRVNMIEELGDLEFYMEGLRQILNITREETIEGNIAKLSTRYKQLTYSNEAAINRADKQQEK